VTLRAPPVPARRRGAAGNRASTGVRPVLASAVTRGGASPARAVTRARPVPGVAAEVLSFLVGMWVEHLPVAVDFAGEAGPTVSAP